jgi:hypothetical protein
LDIAGIVCAERPNRRRENCCCIGVNSPQGCISLGSGRPYSRGYGNQNRQRSNRQRPVYGRVGVQPADRRLRPFSRASVLPYNRPVSRGRPRDRALPGRFLWRQGSRRHTASAPYRTPAHQSVGRTSRRPRFRALGGKSRRGSHHRRRMRELFPQLDSMFPHRYLQSPSKKGADSNYRTDRPETCGGPTPCFFPVVTTGECSQNAPEMIISCAAALRAQEPPRTGTPGFLSCTAIHRQSRPRVAGLMPSGCREPWPHARNGWSPPSPSPTSVDANVRHGQIDLCTLYGERPCVSSPFRPTRTVTGSDERFYPRLLLSGRRRAMIRPIMQFLRTNHSPAAGR